MSQVSWEGPLSDNPGDEKAGDRDFLSPQAMWSHFLRAYPTFTGCLTFSHAPYSGAVK